MEESATQVGIAVVHSTFNIFATLLLLPFGNGLVKLACLTIRDNSNDALVIRQMNFHCLMSVSW